MGRERERKRKNSSLDMKKEEKPEKKKRRKEEKGNEDRRVCKGEKRTKRKTRTDFLEKGLEEVYEGGKKKRKRKRGK